MKELHFTELPSQGSIYSVARLGNSLLVGTGSHGKIYTYSLKGTVEELVLQDLPSGVEIIGLETFDNASPVLCVAVVPKECNDSEDKSKATLLVYSPTSDMLSYASLALHENELSGSTHQINRQFSSLFENTAVMALIEQTPKIFSLDFIPYEMLHVPVKRVPSSYENLLLISGSDYYIHAYNCDADHTSFSPISVGSYFPELASRFDSVVTRVQVEIFNEETRRISICGCEDGSLHIWIATAKEDDKSESSENEVITRHLHYYEGMINCIQPFTDGFQFNVVVASACSPTYVYTNTLEDQFSSGLPLKFSSKWDAVETVCVADIDLDGKAEIIIGTFGCTMLVYKYMEDILPQWVIVAYQKYPSGILHIDFINYSLVVVTASGVHRMEYLTSAYFHKPANILSGTIPEEIVTSSESAVEDDSAFA